MQRDGWAEISFKDKVEAVRRELDISTELTVPDVILKANTEMGFEPQGTAVQEIDRLVQEVGCMVLDTSDAVPFKSKVETVRRELNLDSDLTLKEVIWLASVQLRLESTGSKQLQQVDRLMQELGCGVAGSTDPGVYEQVREDLRKMSTADQSARFSSGDKTYGLIYRMQPDLEVEEDDTQSEAPRSEGSAWEGGRASGGREDSGLRGRSTLPTCARGQGVVGGGLAGLEPLQTQEPVLEDDDWMEPHAPLDMQDTGAGALWEDADWEGATPPPEPRAGSSQSSKGPREEFVDGMRRLGFKMGGVVSITGLRASPHHNGKQGRIVGFDHEAVRLRVLLNHDQKEISVKAANLERKESHSVPQMGLQGVSTALERRAAPQSAPQSAPRPRPATWGGSGMQIARAGVGMVLKDVVRNGQNVLMVKSLTEGGPAKASQRIKVGDCLLLVDGNPVASIYDASSLILGDYGSNISLKFEERNGRGGWDEYSLVLQRGKAAKLDSHVGTDF